MAVVIGVHRCSTVSNHNHAFRFVAAVVSDGLRLAASYWESSEDPTCGDVVPDQ